MIYLSKVPETTIFLVILSSGDFSCDCLPQLFLICFFRSFNQLLLLFIEIVKTWPILRSTIISLPHPTAGIMRFPEPTQNIHKRNFRWIEHDTHSLCVTCPTGTSLLVRRIRRKSCTVTDSSGVNAFRKAPDAFF